MVEPTLKCPRLLANVQYIGIPNSIPIFFKCPLQLSCLQIRSIDVFFSPVFFTFQSNFYFLDWCLCIYEPPLRMSIFSSLLCNLSTLGIAILLVKCTMLLCSLVVFETFQLIMPTLFLFICFFPPVIFSLHSNSITYTAIVSSPKCFRC